MSFPGKYTPIAKLGTGGMADVFLALTSVPVERLVVLKRPRTALQGDERFAPMFLDEAKLAVKLTHPNIVTTYDAFFDNGKPVIVMEYLEGQTLRSIRARVRADAQALPRAVLLRIAEDALAGLHYAHELHDIDGTPLGIVHRDVSPENIFVTYSGLSKLVDFGIAKGHLNSHKSEPGTLKGKYRYLAPEYVRGHAVDHRADIFAMGIVLWELLAGRMLFDGDHAQTLVQILQAEIQPPSALVDGIPSSLDAIVMRALERDPEKRYDSAAQMREDLVAFCAEFNEIADMGDVAETMAHLFPGAREKMQERVKLCVRGLRTQSVGSGVTAEVLPTLTSRMSDAPPAATASPVPRPAEEPPRPASSKETTPQAQPALERETAPLLKMTPPSGPAAPMSTALTASAPRIVPPPTESRMPRRLVAYGTGLVAIAALALAFFLRRSGEVASGGSSPASAAVVEEPLLPEPSSAPPPAPPTVASPAVPPPVGASAVFDAGLVVTRPLAPRPRPRATTRAAPAPAEVADAGATSAPSSAPTPRPASSAPPEPHIKLVDDPPERVKILK